MRRQVVAGAMALAVMVIVLALILTFGVIALPDYPSLADNPDPEIAGTVAFVRVEAEGWCVHTLPAGGGAERVALCSDDVGAETSEVYGPPAVAWTSGGSLVVSAYTSVGNVVHVVDPATSLVRQRISVDESPLGGRLLHDLGSDRSRLPDGTRLGWGRRSGHAYVSVAAGAEVRTLLTAEGPRDYSFDHAQWSPDGAFVLVQDSENRLVVVRSDGEPRPGLLATDAMGAAWFVPGHDVYAIDEAQLSAGG